ncbi:hypothetical protein [Pyrobaculum aerophilum]|uniref:Uncharacterized protein n=2 Tax=Pyrobaculum aerophilum TaxID=13773 RepID=Q8ZY54_PYRAE|nr:hypothetical protein [Pyrobaculum aerophilum]AAL63142.1 hypothetical protein PAE0941 [Pyrobaculum aerophilum str. IM2]MCX8137067.1 hypothetical protein [Pyrobaculum aerophilum]HII48094.1 hypothetical protein [Pyrobaculum aerophilum]
MDILGVEKALSVIPRLTGNVLYIYGPCQLYKYLNTRYIAVKRLSLELADLIEALKYGLVYAPDLIGFQYTVVEGVSDEEAEFLAPLEMSQLGNIIYVKC